MDGIEKERPALVRLAGDRLRGTGIDAEDVVQKALAYLARRGDHIRPETRGTYLQRVVLRFAQNAHRGHRRDRQVKSTFMEDLMRSPAWDGWQADQRERQMREDVRAAVQTVPEPGRSLAWRIWALDEPIRDVARDLGLTVLGATLRLGVARDRLRLALGAYQRGRLRGTAPALPGGRTPLSHCLTL